MKNKIKIEIETYEEDERIFLALKNWLIDNIQKFSIKLNDLEYTR